MSIKYIKKIPTAEKIKEEMPLTNNVKEFKKLRDIEIKNVFENNSDKFLIIVGPCSADNEDSVCEYIGKLAKVQEKVKDSIIIIPRIYTNKPRTTGEGYKGMASQPDPSKDTDMVAGLRAIRKLHL